MVERKTLALPLFTLTDYIYREYLSERMGYFIDITPK